MMRRLRKSVLGLVAVLGLASAGNAALLVQDDFEGVGATSAFPVTEGASYYPGKAWTLQNASSQAVAVYDSAAASVYEGNQALRLMKTSEPPMLRADFEGSQTVELSFALFVPSSNKNNRTLNLNLQDASNLSNVRTGPYLAINNGSNGWGICAIDSSYTWKTIVTPKVDEWAMVTINADAVGKTFTLTYDGQTYDNNGNGFRFFDWSDNLSFTRLFLSQSGAGIDTRIDDVTVAVPEPATVGLLIVSGLGMLLRRRTV